MARSFGGPKGKQSPPAIRRALFALAVAGPPGVLPDAERWRRMSTRSAVLDSRRSRNLSPAPPGNWRGFSTPGQAHLICRRRARSLSTSATRPPFALQRHLRRIISLYTRAPYYILVCVFAQR